MEAHVALEDDGMQRRVLGVVAAIDYVRQSISVLTIVDKMPNATTAPNSTRRYKLRVVQVDAAHMTQLSLPQPQDADLEAVLKQYRACGQCERTYRVMTGDTSRQTSHDDELKALQAEMHEMQQQKQQHINQKHYAQVLECTETITNKQQHIMDKHRQLEILLSPSCPFCGSDKTTRGITADIAFSVSK